MYLIFIGQKISYFRHYVHVRKSPDDMKKSHVTCFILFKLYLTLISLPFFPGQASAYEDHLHHGEMIPSPVTAATVVTPGPGSDSGLSGLDQTDTKRFTR